MNRRLRMLACVAIGATLIAATTMPAQAYIGADGVWIPLDSSRSFFLFAAPGGRTSATCLGETVPFIGVDMQFTTTNCSAMSTFAQVGTVYLMRVPGGCLDVHLTWAHLVAFPNACSHVTSQQWWFPRYYDSHTNREWFMVREFSPADGQGDTSHDNCLTTNMPWGSAVVVPCNYSDPAQQFTHLP